MKQHSKGLQRGVVRQTRARYYLHCYNYKLDGQGKKQYISTDLYIQEALSLEDLYWRLRGKYGLTYGDYVDNEHSKQIGYAFIEEKERRYTEVEILLQPRVSTWTSVYPRFPKENDRESITELDREYIPEYKKVDFPLPTVPPMKRRG